MKTIESISYHNTVYFQDAVLDLDREGVTFVTGLNRNSTKGAKSNGAGKTLLVSGLPHFRHGSPVGQSSLHRHSLLTEPDSFIRWKLHDGDAAWLFQKSRKGKGVGWKAEKNNEPVTVRTAAQAEQLIASVFDFNDEEFYSTVYLDSRRHNPIIHGGGTARQAFVSNLFRLEGYSELRAWFTEKLKAANNKRAALDELRNSLKKMGQTSENDLKKLRKQTKTVNAAAKELETAAAKARQDLEARKAYDKFVDLEASANKHNADDYKAATALLEQWSSYDADVSLWKRTKKAAADYDKAEKTIAALLAESNLSIDKLREKTLSAKTQQRHMKAHLDSGEGKCPFCGSNLDKKTAKRRLAEAKGVLAELLPKLRDLESLSRKQPARRPKTSKKPSRPKASRKQAEISLEKHRKRKWAFDTREEMRKVGLSPERAGSLPKTEILRKNLSKVVKALKKTRKRKEKLTAKTAAVESMLKTRAETEKRITELADGAKDSDVLGVLADCYGPKGLRVLAVKNIAQAVQDNLNAMSPYLCPEKMEFELNAAAHNSMEISVERSDGRKSDVRHLSGAESRVFQLLWTAATLPLLPNDRRCNVAVLDEFEAGVDDVTRELMIGEYLPKLNTLVPHILFLSPYETKPEIGRRVLQVEKRGGISTVKELTC